MGIQASASNTDRLFQCPRPFDPDLWIDWEQNAPEEPALWGRAGHLYLADGVVKLAGGSLTASEALSRHGLPASPGMEMELASWRGAAMAALTGFMGGKNPWDANYEIEICEQPHRFNFDSPTPEAEPCGFEEAGHLYTLDDPKKEIGLTPDYVLKLARGEGPRRVVVDLKTGNRPEPKYTTPELMGQMLTLGMGFRADAIAILHAPRDGRTPAVHATTVAPEDLKGHRERLRGALALVGSGFMRTGPECQWCAARHDCPAQVADRIEKTRALMVAAGGVVARGVATGTLTQGVEDLGAFIEGSRKLEKLMKEAREEIGERVRAGEVAEDSDGRVYRLVGKKRRQISFKSIEKALGRVRGDKEIERLDLLGCIDVVEYEELTAR